MYDIFKPRFHQGLIFQEPFGGRKLCNCIRGAVQQFLRSVRRLLVTANVVPSSPILVTLMMEALSSSETSVLTRAIRRNIQGAGILHSHCRENLKSYIELTGWTL
jgi:hypothetical protein